MAYGSVNVSGDYLGDLLGVPGGLATLGADGILAEGQRPEVDAYTKVEADQLLREVISSHDAAEDAHPDIRLELSTLKADLQRLKLRVDTSITQNAFSVGFAALTDTTVTGVWNKDLQRIEF